MIIDSGVFRANTKIVNDKIKTYAAVPIGHIFMKRHYLKAGRAAEGMKS